MKIRPKALEMKTEGSDSCITVCIQQGSLISPVRCSYDVFQHTCILLINPEVRQESNYRLRQPLLPSKDWHITHNLWHHRLSISRMAACQAAAATEYLAQHCCFHDSYMQTHSIFPLILNDHTNRTLCQPSRLQIKLDPPSHTMWKTVLLQNHSIREKTLT